MSFEFFVPTNFEIPKRFQKRATAFGMGEVSARALGKKLNEVAPKKGIIIFGCAGALSPTLKAGMVFEVTDLAHSNFQAKVTPKTSLPQARLWTSPTLVPTPQQKAALFEKTSASLVDMEMAYVVEEVQPELRDRLVLLRGVLDPQDSELIFLNAEGRPKLSAFLTLRGWQSFGKFLGALSAYRAGIESALLDVSPN